MSTENQTPYVPVSVPVPPVSVREWIITFLLMIIPFVNIILLFVWAFSSDTNPSKANFAKAYLIWILIGIALGILFVLIFGTAIYTALQEQGLGHY